MPLYILLRICSYTLTKDIRHLIKLSFNAPKPTRGLDALSVSVKQKIVRVKNVKDNDEDVNQFEKMSLFTNPMNIKHIEKDFDKNLMPSMRKCGNKKFV
jgi:hypothetical protein